MAVPRCWIDVNEVADLEAIAVAFRRAHGRPFRVATKYINLARRFLSAKGLADYRIVESLGATEGTPAAGTADLIVDITTTGATLCGQRSEGARGRRHPALGGEPRRLENRQLERRHAKGAR